MGEYIMQIEPYNVPITIQELVRCKDCKYVVADATCCLVCKREGMGLKAYHVYDDDFCSYAERRPMDDLISRQAAYETLTAYYHHKHITQHITLKDALDKIPSAQPERKKGKWVEQDDSWGGVYYESSVCGNAWTTIDGTPYDNGMNFCPSCGADMRKEG